MSLPLIDIIFTLFPCSSESPRCRHRAISCSAFPLHVSARHQFRRKPGNRFLIMAKWSDLRHGSAPNSDENGRSGGLSDADNRPPVEGRLDGSRVEYIDGLRSLFYKVLVAFLKDVADRDCVHPILAKIGDGQLVDLFELYCTVRRRGGYGAVSESCEWGLVTEELGFDPSSISSLKLMHFKYLSQFDAWLRDRCRDVLVDNEKRKCGLDGFGTLSLELEMGFKVLVQLPVPHSDSKIKLNHQCKIGDGGAESFSILSSKVPDAESRKRKPESLDKMLLWITDVAKHPDDLGAGSVLEESKLRDQVLLARNCLFQRRTRQSNWAIQGAPEKKLKVHPSNYSDPKKSSTCSKSLPTLAKSSLSSPCHSSLVPPSRSISPKEQLENSHKIQVPERLTESKDDRAHTDISMFPFDDPNPDDKPIGPLFQAQVPEWTGVVSESDPKWLGTKVWSCQSDTESLGKGRANSCSCLVPGSAECVRFHIAEKRMRLKLQLGCSLFYDWRFHCTGEEVSLRWTPEEETTFKDIVRSSKGKCFWDDLFRYFPKKTREDLVSYYFNVFLLRRRRYQNRVTPKEIDSDDDDSDFGSFGDCLEHGRAQICDFLPCSLSEQWTDWGTDANVK